MSQLKTSFRLGARMVWLSELSNAILKNDLAYIDCWAGAPAATQPAEPEAEVEPEPARRRE